MLFSKSGKYKFSNYISQNIVWIIESEQMVFWEEKKNRACDKLIGWEINSGL